MQLSQEDQVLDCLWRRKFKQPLPILGAHVTVRAILREYGVSDEEMTPAPRKTGASKLRPCSSDDASVTDF